MSALSALIRPAAVLAIVLMGNHAGAQSGPPPNLDLPTSKPGQIAFVAGGEDGTGPYAPAGSPAPSTDPHDLRGVWLIDEFRLFTTVDGKEPPLNAAGQNLWWYRRARDNAGTPETSPGGQCQPPGHFVAGKFRVIQTPDRVVFTFEELHAVWSIYLNGKHPTNLKPSFMGHSVGHWEGDALVVDVVGFNDATWMEFSGLPRSDALHMVVRISKMDKNRRLQFLFSIDDPKMYTQPFTTLRRARWRPDMELEESNCEAAQIVDPQLIKR